jgi:hypothetical protein
VRGLTAVRLTAQAVAAPLSRFVDRDVPLETSVLGSSSTSAYLVAGDFVIAITGQRLPLMPNGVRAIQTDGLDVFHAGARAWVSREEIRASGVVIGLTSAEVRELGVPRNQGYRTEDVARRGRDLLGALNFEDPFDPVEALARARPELAAADGLRGARALLAALLRGDSGMAKEASLELAGRGPGLTPDGDDLLAAAAAATIAFESPVDLPSEAAGSLRAALPPADLDRRTGALSATLLRLSVEGHVIDPVRSILDLSTSQQTWIRALARLQRIGHGTGRTYAVGCALAALALSHHVPAIDRPEHEERNWT